MAIALGIAFGVALVPLVWRLMRTLERGTNSTVRYALGVDWRRVAGIVAALIIGAGMVLFVRELTTVRHPAVARTRTVGPDTVAPAYRDSEPYLLRSELCSDSAARVVRQSSNRAQNAMTDRTSVLSLEHFDSLQKVIAAVAWWESTCHRTAH